MFADPMALQNHLCLMIPHLPFNLLLAPSEATLLPFACGENYISFSPDNANSFFKSHTERGHANIDTNYNGTLILPRKPRKIIRRVSSEGYPQVI